MKVLFLTLTIFFIQSARAEYGQARRIELMQMVQQEIKILEKGKSLPAKLEYRLLELYTERLKLVQEKNNTEFLKASTTGKLSKPKKEYFVETNNHYQHLRKYGLSLIKSKQAHPFHPEITFNIGITSIDYSNGDLAEKMLLISIKSAASKKNVSRKHLAESALAEYYYNEKRYDQAIRYYEALISNKEDTWLAKHSYNLSWCYLKERHLEKASSTMRAAIGYNANPKYVKISGQMLESLASFYTFLGKPLEALELYQSGTGDLVPLLISLGKKASEKGQPKEAEKILAEAQRRIIKEKSPQHQEAIYHAYLDYFNEYGKYKEHAQVAGQLTRYYLENGKGELKPDAIKKFRAMAGIAQLKLTKDMKHDHASYNQQELTHILEYYSHLVSLDPGNKAEYLYFQGETNYSVHRLLPAAISYSASIEESYKTKNNAMTEKSINSLLDLTAQEKLDKPTNNKYLIFAYTMRIKLWPKDEKSRIIYTKLYELFVEQGLDLKSSGVMIAYNQAFPQDLKQQQAMMTRVLNQLIERKDTVKYGAWIIKFKQGFLAYNQTDILKMEQALANLLFKEYQELSKTGKKLAAAKGFEKIYQNKLYSGKVKGEAAMFASMAHLELADTKQSVHWVQLAVKHMTESELLAHRLELLKMTERTYMLQDFAAANELATSFQKRYCHLKDETQNRFFEVSIMTALVEGKTAEAEKTVDNFSHCLKHHAARVIALKEIYYARENDSDFKGLRKFVQSHPSVEINAAYRQTLNRWYWEKNDQKLKQEIVKEFVALNHPQTIQWAKEIALLENAQKKMEELKNIVIWNANIFDGEAFNKILENHLQDHKHFKANYQALTQSSQMEVIIRGSRIFSQLYLNLGKKIQSLAPAGMAPVTMKEFQQAMNPLGLQFLAASVEYDSQLKKVFQAQDNLVGSNQSISLVEEIENPVFSGSTTVTMDKVVTK